MNAPQAGPSQAAARRIAALYIHPIKSARAVAVTRARVGPMGLEGDRRWMVVDAVTGRFVSQRTDPGMARWIPALEDDGALTVRRDAGPVLTVRPPEPGAETRSVRVWGGAFQAQRAGDAADAWVSDALGRGCQLVYMHRIGERMTEAGYGETQRALSFSDGFPLLVLGAASVEAFAGRVGAPLTPRHFRPNVVVSGAEAFEEDRWERVRLGGVEVDLVKPCSRCRMVDVDPDSGEVHPDGAALRGLARLRRWEGAVWMGQNGIQRAEGVLAVGDAVEPLRWRAPLPPLDPPLGPSGG